MLHLFLSRLTTLDQFLTGAEKLVIARRKESKIDLYKNKY